MRAPRNRWDVHLYSPHMWLPHLGVPTPVAPRCQEVGKGEKRGNGGPGSTMKVCKFLLLSSFGGNLPTMPQLSVSEAREILSSWEALHLLKLV